MDNKGPDNLNMLTHCGETTYFEPNVGPLDTRPRRIELDTDTFNAKLQEALEKRYGTRSLVALQKFDKERTEELERRNKLLREEMELLQRPRGFQHEQVEDESGNPREVGEIGMTMRDFLDMRIRAGEGDKLFLVAMRDGLVRECLELTPAEKKSFWQKVKGFFSRKQ